MALFLDVQSTVLPNLRTIRPVFQEILFQTHRKGKSTQGSLYKFGALYSIKFLKRVHYSSIKLAQNVVKEHSGLASQPLFFFFFLVKGEEKKNTSGDFSQVFVGLSQNVGTANQITSVS